MWPQLKFGCPLAVQVQIPADTRSIALYDDGQFIGNKSLYDSLENVAGGTYNHVLWESKVKWIGVFDLLDVLFGQSNVQCFEVR